MMPLFTLLALKGVLVQNSASKLFFGCFRPQMNNITKTKENGKETRIEHHSNLGPVAMYPRTITCKRKRNGPTRDRPTTFRPSGKRAITTAPSFFGATTGSPYKSCGPICLNISLVRTQVCVISCRTSDRCSFRHIWQSSTPLPPSPLLPTPPHTSI